MAKMLFPMVVHSPNGENVVVFPFLFREMDDDGMDVLFFNQHAEKKERKRNFQQIWTHELETF